MYFDVRAAKLLQPGGHLLVQGCAGLRLVVSASRKTWTYRYKAADGRMKQVSLGQWPAMPVQEAAARWRVLADGKSAGVDPAQEKRQARALQGAPAAGPPTVADVVKAFVAGPLRDGRAPAGYEAARRALQRVLDEDREFARAVAHEVTRAKAFDVIERKKPTPTAAAKLRSLLGAAWEHAQDSGLICEAPNWWREVLRGKLRSKGKVLGGEHQGRQRRVLAVQEVAQLLQWLPNMHSVGADAVVLYLWTAARGAEIFNMRPEHVREEQGVLWWTVAKAQTKNARFENAVDLRVPLLGRAADVVRRRMAGVGLSGWLFEAASGKRYTQHDFSTYVYDLQPYSVKAQARAHRLVLPVSGWTAHHLRKTARTLLAQVGCPNEIGEAIVGHIPKDVVGTYNAYSYDAERLHWLGKLDGLLASLAGDAPARP